VKAVPWGFDPARFATQGASDPSSPLASSPALATVIEQEVYQGPSLVVHLVDDVLPCISPSPVDTPALLAPKKALPSGVYCTVAAQQYSAVQYQVIMSCTGLY